MHISDEMLTDDVLRNLAALSAEDEKEWSWSSYPSRSISLMAAELLSRRAAEQQTYVSFNDWFNEPEGYALRSERFEGDVEWLKAAFEAGKSCRAAGQREPVPGPVEHEAWKKRAIAAGALVDETPFGTIATFRFLDQLIAFASPPPVPAGVSEAIAQKIEELSKRQAAAFACGDDREGNALWRAHVEILGLQRAVETALHEVPHE